MASIYEEIEIEDMDYDEDLKTYFYPCPCGDKFRITVVGNHLFLDTQHSLNELPYPVATLLLWRNYMMYKEGFATLALKFIDNAVKY